MKKLAILIVIMISVGFTYSLTFTKLGGNAQDIEYSIFTKGDSGSGGIWLYGDTYMISCPSSQLNEMMVTLSNVIGYQARFSGSYDDARDNMARQSVTMLSSQTLGGVLIMYGVSDKYGRSVLVDGKLVNVQVAVRGSIITVGTPLIMGSY